MNFFKVYDENNVSQMQEAHDALVDITSTMVESEKRFF